MRADRRWGRAEATSAAAGLTAPVSARRTVHEPIGSPLRRYLVDLVIPATCGCTGVDITRATDTAGADPRATAGGGRRVYDCRHARRPVPGSSSRTGGGTSAEGNRPRDPRGRRRVPGVVSARDGRGSTATAAAVEDHSQPPPPRTVRPRRGCLRDHPTLRARTTRVENACAPGDCRHISGVICARTRSAPRAGRAFRDLRDRARRVTRSSRRRDADARRRRIAAFSVVRTSRSRRSAPPCNRCSTRSRRRRRDALAECSAPAAQGRVALFGT